MPPPRQDALVERDYGNRRILKLYETEAEDVFLGVIKKSGGQVRIVYDDLNNLKRSFYNEISLPSCPQDFCSAKSNCHSEHSEESQNSYIMRSFVCTQDDIKRHDGFLKRNYTRKKRCAFTLAEVLITLGIIGVVAALTMPALIQNYKYMVLQNQLKTAYSDLNQAAKLFQVHNDMSVSEFAAASTPSNTLKEFQKEFTAAIKTSNLKDGSTDSDGNWIGPKPYDWHSITGASVTGSTCDQGGFFWDTQGRVISVDDNPQTGKNGPKVCIDINGEKGPNRYGMDFFVFMFTTDGYVIPWGQEHKDNPNCTTTSQNCTVSIDACKYSSSQNDVFACANYALIDRHPTDSSKTYWKHFVRGK